MERWREGDYVNTYMKLKTSWSKYRQKSGKTKVTVEKLWKESLTFLVMKLLQTENLNNFLKAIENGILNSLHRYKWCTYSSMKMELNINDIVTHQWRWL